MRTWSHGSAERSSAARAPVSGARAREDEPEGGREAEGRDHLRVEERRVEEDRRADDRRPRHERRVLVGSRVPRERAGDEAETRGYECEEHEAGAAAAERVDGRDEERQAGAVRRVRPAVRPPRAARHVVEASEVLVEVPAGEVVAQVEVALAPDALRHHQVVDLVARGLDRGRVVDRDARGDERREQEEGRGGSPQPRSAHAAAAERREHRHRGEHGAERAREEAERGHDRAGGGRVRGREHQGRLHERRRAVDEAPHGAAPPLRTALSAARRRRRRAATPRRRGRRTPPSAGRPASRRSGRAARGSPRRRRP